MNYPIINSDSITWSKEALDFIQATKTEPCSMIAELVITMEAAIEAVWNVEVSGIYDMTSNEFLNSDSFINNPANQRKVIEYVLNKWILWQQ